MNFEKLTFNAEQEPITPDFLQKQVRLPKDQWNEKFRQLVEDKIKENQQDQREEIEETPEVLREHTFKRYIDGLGLHEEDMKEKIILDLGSGKGEFVQSLIEKGITSGAYGVDAKVNDNVIEDKMKSHFFKGNFEEDLPIQNVDYMISVGAISNGVWGGEETMNIRRIVEKSLASLKENGEIRIYPIQEAAEVNPLEGLQVSQKKWKELLEEISEAQNVECKIEPRNIKVTGNNNDIILESVLIIKRKNK